MNLYVQERITPQLKQANTSDRPGINVMIPIRADDAIYNLPENQTKGICITQ